MAKKARVIVIGFDGATWDLIKPWAHKGILPRFHEMLATGTSADLESTIPPITGPAWVSFATGKNPGKHGIYDFILPRGSLSNLTPITTRDIKTETFYEILDRNGKRCILINLPASWPSRIEAPVITSLLTQGDECIFPKGLVEKIPELRSYRILPNLSLLVNERLEEYISDIRRVESTRFECSKRLFEEEWDFFFLLFSGMDEVHHIVFDKLIQGGMEEDSEIMRLYKDLDGYLGWFLDNVPLNATLLVISDHGFRTFESTFFVNEWLRQNGFLTVERKAEPPVPRHRADEAAQRAQSRKLKVRLTFLPLMNTRIYGWMYSIYVRLRKILPINVVIGNYQPKMLDTVACSTCYPLNFASIYINDKRRFVDGRIEPSEYEDVRAAIMDQLAQVRDPIDERKVHKNVWRKEDIYHGSALDIGPDLILESDDCLISRKLPSNTFQKQTCRNHALNGIFAAYGTDIRCNIQQKHAKIYDIAPTILHILGLPVPDDMDGRVFKDIFKERSEPARRDVRFEQVDIERHKISD